MGRRTRTASVAAVMAAFLTRRTWWSQVDLARAVGIGTDALRQILGELRDNGLPLQSEKEHPHVYWRMPRDWYPGGVLFKEEFVPELLRQLTHLSTSRARDRLLAIVMDQLPAGGKLTATAPVISRATSETEEQYVPIVEDAAARKLPVFMRYLTASRGGKLGERHVSVHAVDVGPPSRFIATCHRSGDLRWFRVDGIVRARIDDGEKFRPCDAGELAEFRAASLDGYKGAGPPMACAFFVREPEASWVANNLLEGMRVETVRGGIRVSIETSGLLPLARFVVGLGEAARPESTALAQAVAELARGALESADASLRDEQNRRAVEDVDGDPVRARSHG
jgi:predicted DNA-binding transcriptional regulator YafY